MNAVNTGFPWITTIALIPLVGAALTWVLPSVAPAIRARTVALVFSLVTLGLVIAMALQFEVADGGAYQFSEVHSWIPEFGASYAVGLNGIGLTMVALSVFLVPVCVLASWNQFDVLPDPDVDPEDRTLWKQLAEETGAYIARKSDLLEQDPLF